MQHARARETKCWTRNRPCSVYRPDLTVRSRAIARMLLLAESKGFEFGCRHHGAYLSDPRRAAQEKLKTLVRRPVQSDTAIAASRTVGRGCGRRAALLRIDRQCRAFLDCCAVRRKGGRGLWAKRVCRTCLERKAWSPRSSANQGSIRSQARVERVSRWYDKRSPMPENPATALVGPAASAPPLADGVAMRSSFDL